MLRLPLQRLFNAFVSGQKLVRYTVSAANELNKQPHVYKKTYTEDELIKYLKDNVVYETDKFTVTSVPQGIEFRDESRQYFDFEGAPVCEISLQFIIHRLRDVFNNSNNIFITKYPRRNASGLVLLSKNYSSFVSLRKKICRCVLNNEQIHNYIALVFGCPKETVSQNFYISQVTVGDHLETEILNSKVKMPNVRKSKYSHKVLASKESFSLLQINVSYDERDTVRHILAQKCCTPAFGDLWNMKRETNFFMGAPLKSSIFTYKKDTYKLDPELLNKLQLNPGDEKYIPIHVHLHSLSMPLKKKKEFFVSVPPPESFIWTCRQLGLNEIEQFVKASENE